MFENHKYEDDEFLVAIEEHFDKTRMRDTRQPWFTDKSLRNAAMFLLLELLGATLLTLPW